MSATGLEILPASPRALRSHAGHPSDRRGRPVPCRDGPVRVGAVAASGCRARGRRGGGRDPRSVRRRGPDLVVCFVSPHFVGAFDDIAYALGNLLEPEVLHRRDRGGRHRRRPRGRGRARGLAVRGARCPTPGSRRCRSRSRPRPTAPRSRAGRELDHDRDTLLLLADPFSFPTDGFLRQLDEVRPGLQVIGGAASAAARTGRQPARARRSRRRRPGAVGVLLDGVEVRTVVSQGCRPIGRRSS